MQKGSGAPSCCRKGVILAIGFRVVSSCRSGDSRVADLVPLPATGSPNILRHEYLPTESTVWRSSPWLPVLTSAGGSLPQFVNHLFCFCFVEPNVRVSYGVERNSQKATCARALEQTGIGADLCVSFSKVQRGHDDELGRSATTVVCTVEAVPKFLFKLFLLWFVFTKTFSPNIAVTSVAAIVSSSAAHCCTLLWFVLFHRFQCLSAVILC